MGKIKEKSLVGVVAMNKTSSRVKMNGKAALDKVIFMANINYLP